MLTLIDIARGKHSQTTPITEGQLQQLSELLRIESISSDGAHPGELREAADWVARLIGGGGSARVPQPDRRRPIPAQRPAAPTVIVYGHYDVQAPGA